MKRLKVRHKKHLLKTITWRLVGTIDTIVLSRLVIGDPLVGLKIVSFELITKMVLYYIHEYLWHEDKKESHKKHLLKTITWRLVGTTDTVMLSWLISGNPLAGLKIGGFEIISKMTLYYLHERVWHRFEHNKK